MRLTRFTLIIIALIIGSGFYLLVRRQLDEVEPQTYQATEEAMVDAAHVLAAFAETSIVEDRFEAEQFRAAFNNARSRGFEARIFKHVKTDVGLGAYLTNRDGIVVFDSEDGRREGRDFSNLRDVALTMRGEYGARSSRSAEDDSSSSILHVGAPVGDPAEPWGVLTVYKPQADVLPIVRRRSNEIWWGTWLIGGGILFLVGSVFIWQYRPVSRLTEYARAIEQGKRPPLPKLGAGREVNTLAGALESMREALEGRRYAERYVQTLTHEMKSPLAAIRGAAELLDEDMKPADRSRFLSNIRAETLRADRLLNRLLELSALEGRTRLDALEPVDLGEIVARAVHQAVPMADLANVAIDFPKPESPVDLRGDAFILRAAVSNLLENAIDFSPAGALVSVRLERHERELRLTVTDRGPGIPDYARDKVFERFFSLRHLQAGRKGTGLGLTLVREAVELHGGSVSLDDAPDGGTCATLVLPRNC